MVSDVEATATSLALIAHGHLVRRAAPEELLRAMDGRVWNWVVSSSDLPSVRERHLVSGTLRRANDVHVRFVAAEPPHSNASPLAPTLEDAYLDALRGHREERAA